MKNKYLSCQIEKNLKICSENEEKMIETVLESQNFRLRRACATESLTSRWKAQFSHLVIYPPSWGIFST